MQFQSFLHSSNVNQRRQNNFLIFFRCPSDLYVFPELHKTPDGALEAEFYAFKLPDSNFLVFQATVRTCRGPCEPVSATFVKVSAKNRIFFI